jgi:phosphotransferase system  glucose/maltose/N-acetylglucosamine-specific IIC component
LALEALRLFFGIWIYFWYPLSGGQSYILFLSIGWIVVWALFELFFFLRQRGRVKEEESNEQSQTDAANPVVPA